MADFIARGRLKSERVKAEAERERSRSEEHSENAKEQDKNQTSIGRMQSDSRSETGIIKILTVL